MEIFSPQQHHYYVNSPSAGNVCLHLILVMDREQILNQSGTSWKFNAGNAIKITILFFEVETVGALHIFHYTTHVSQLIL